MNRSFLGTLDDEPEVVEQARRWWSRTGDPATLMAAVRTATLTTRRLDGPPRLTMVDSGVTGRWVLGFTSLERLARRIGACDWISMPGGELLDVVATLDVQGLVVDAGEPHWVAIPTTVSPAPVLTGPVATMGDQR